MYVCMYACVYVCMYACMYVLCMYACMYVFLYSLINNNRQVNHQLITTTMTVYVQCCHWKLCLIVHMVDQSSHKYITVQLAACTVALGRE